MMTGSEYFPGGLGEFVAKANEFLEFEEGPSVDVVLQWATYKDASDQTSLSRIWGGIHPPADDIPGRFIGHQVAEDTFNFAIPYFNGSLSIDDNQEGIVIYPNPVTNGNVFLSNTNGTETIEIFDMSGRQIDILNRTFEEVNATTTLKLNVAATGLYLLRVNNKSKMIVIKD
jgi:hypothetical protein